mmetsp:Transcript_12131/g.21916  ORF Transcript_12131/g.21916 Transcript_12131/m.21916 type:complete len:283 (+) Transcript_12131:316-1164(+)
MILSHNLYSTSDCTNYSNPTFPTLPLLCQLGNHNIPHLTLVGPRRKLVPLLQSKKLATLPIDSQVGKHGDHSLRRRKDDIRQSAIRKYLSRRHGSSRVLIFEVTSFAILENNYRLFHVPRFIQKVHSLGQRIPRSPLLLVQKRSLQEILHAIPVHIGKGVVGGLYRIPGISRVRLPARDGRRQCRRSKGAFAVHLLVESHQLVNPDDISIVILLRSVVIAPASGGHDSPRGGEVPRGKAGISREVASRICLRWWHPVEYRGVARMQKIFPVNLLLLLAVISR